MKYRNDMTNIGLLCGFATNEADGRLAVHQTSSRETAFRLTRRPEARPAQYDFEPVTVVFRVLPGADGDEPQMEALHVTRMARSVVPSTFYWNARSWPRSLEFYPFERTQAGKLTEEIEKSLVDEHDLPQWLRDAAQEDDSLADLLEGPTSNKHLLTRLLLTGYMAPGEIVPVPREKAAHDFLRVRLRQGLGDEPIGLRMPPGTKGYHFMAENRCGEDGIPGTAMIKPIVAYDYDGEQVTNVHVDLLMLEINAPLPCDYKGVSA